MKVEQVFSDRKRFLDLLLLADEQEDMIDRYLERGDMFALYDEDKLRAVCVVTNEGKGTRVWQLIANTCWSDIGVKGRYLIAALNKAKRK